MARGRLDPVEPTMEGERRLIIHADDYGLSPAVNAGVLEAHAAGTLTSTSIMAVGRGYDDAVRRWRTAPTLDVGIHLTLVEEEPMLPPGRIPSLVGPEGRFAPDAFAFARRLVAGKVEPREVYRELHAQISRVMAEGLPVSHLDSHQHLHMLPGLHDVVLRLAERFGIPAVRIPSERLTPSLVRHSPSPVRTCHAMVLKGVCRWVSRRSPGLVSTDHFSGFLFGGQLTFPRLELMLRSLPRHGSVEVVCHPSLPDPEGWYDHWGYDGEGELAALLDPALPPLLEELGFSLVGFRDLG